MIGPAPLAPGRLQQVPCSRRNVPIARWLPLELPRLRFCHRGNGTRRARILTPTLLRERGSAPYE